MNDREKELTQTEQVSNRVKPVTSLSEEDLIISDFQQWQRDTAVLVLGIIEESRIRLHPFQIKRTLWTHYHNEQAGVWVDIVFSRNNAVVFRVPYRKSIETTNFHLAHSPLPGSPALTEDAMIVESAIGVEATMCSPYHVKVIADCVFLEVIQNIGGLSDPLGYAIRSQIPD